MANLRKNRARRLQYESLESRTVMAAGITASLNSLGVLTITGTDGADQIRLKQSTGRISISGYTGSWLVTSVNSITIDLKGGDDYVSLDSIKNGGTQTLAEQVTVKSGAGRETVYVASGKQSTFSGAGHTLIVSTNGTATLDGWAASWGSPAPSTNWFDANVVDAALRTLGRTLYADGRIDRNDMIALLRNAGDGDAIDATEFNDLKKMVSSSTLFGSLDYVWKLSTYIVSGSVANAKYQGQSLGNLAAGSTSAQMEKLIGKWFLGLDRPTASGSYRQCAGTLFVSGATYGDIKQGSVGDCYFMASLAEVACKNASTITNMFVVNGDGTYTVKFFNQGTASYVTVDSYLPTDSAGRLIYAGMGKYASSTANELWTMLAEKAYVQLNEMGWQRAGLSGSGQNSYTAISGGYIYAALGHITGSTTTPFASTSSTTSFTTFVTAFNGGKLIGFASKSTPASSSVVGNHAYAVVGYNATNQTVTLFNPWGTEYGLVTMSWSQIQANFSYFDRTA